MSFHGIVATEAGTTAPTTCHSLNTMATIGTHTTAIHGDTITITIIIIDTATMITIGIHSDTITIIIDGSVSIGLAGAS